MNISPHLWGILGDLPADLEEMARRSCVTPQWGPHHKEGIFMGEWGSHLERVYSAIGDVLRGEFHPAVPEDTGIREVMQAAARQYKLLIGPYVMLHDVEKRLCMTLVYTDGRKEAVEWPEFFQRLAHPTEAGVTAWDVMQESRVRAMITILKHYGIVQISYYQDTPDGPKRHGKEAAEMLRERGGMDDLLIRAIETHEIAFTFGERNGINIPLFEATFGDWTADEVGFALLVNYADQMGSLGKDFEPDISDFLWLAAAWTAYGKYMEFQKRMAEEDRIDRHRLDRISAILRDARDAFAAESVDGAVSRATGECRLPSYDKAKLVYELDAFVVRGVLTEADALELLDALLATGQIPREIGQKLGAANRDVRAAIARAAIK